MKILLTICALFITTSVYAAPAITSVSGSMSSGSSITITGAGFGSSGPSIAVFDEFNGSSGNNINLSGAAVGSWDYVDSGTVSAVYGDGNTLHGVVNGGESILTTVFSRSTEVFIYYRMKPGNYFPNTASPGTFPAESSWKIMWFMDGDGGSTDDANVCVPTWPSVYWRMIGNYDGIGSPLTVGGDDNATPGRERWYSFGNWNHFAAWFHEGVSSSWDQYAMGMSSEHGLYEWSNTTTINWEENAGHNGLDGYDRLKVSPWYDDGGAEHNVFFDDIYVAYGANAAARVLMCNSDTFTSSTNCAILTPETWSDTSISATVRTGLFSESDSVYFYVYDADNTISASDGPYTLGSVSGGDTTAPTVTPTDITNQPSGTTTVTPSTSCSDDTDCTACKWDTSNVAYTSMSFSMTESTGWTSDSALSVSDGNSYTVYYGCTDAASNYGYANDSFTVSSPGASNTTELRSGSTVLRAGSTKILP